MNGLPSSCFPLLPAPAATAAAATAAIATPTATTTAPAPIPATTTTTTTTTTTAVVASRRPNCDSCRRRKGSGAAEVAEAQFP